MDLSLDELARAAGEPVEHIREWRAAGLLGDPTRERWALGDVERVRLLALLHRRGLTTETIRARSSEFELYLGREAERRWVGPLADAARSAGLDPALAE